ncbi:carbonic anhydrase 1-like [Ostrea edulis]|uniref:carbonic anhydrase 1-like n=1 Tax=Ostrea edulis TaxID=37623 RepID=UPI0024AF24A3|nr:carbonic anhydrase 1-like [Ostrea edulis]
MDTDLVRKSNRLNPKPVLRPKSLKPSYENVLKLLEPGCSISDLAPIKASTLIRQDDPGKSDMESNTQFTYNPNSMRGPPMWNYLWKECRARGQSPIDISTQRVLYKRGYKINYNLENIRTSGMFVNNGHSCAFYPDKKLRVLYGVPHSERDMYVFDQIHFHFGNDLEHGSEHSMDGRFFPIELHMVHYNSKYGDAKNASKYVDGTVALSVLFEVGHNGPSEVDKFIQTYVPRIKKPKYDGVQAVIDLSGVLPYNRDFFTYYGSKTTPPCERNTRWIIFRQHRTITRKSHRLLFLLMNKEGERISRYGNFRPVQDISCRLVEANF